MKAVKRISNRRIGERIAPAIAVIDGSKAALDYGNFCVREQRLDAASDNRNRWSDDASQIHSGHDPPRGLKCRTEGVADPRRRVDQRPIQIEDKSVDSAEADPVKMRR